MLKLLATAVSAIVASLSTPNGDVLPDFSRVGYKWGDEDIPTVKVVKKISAPKGEADATKLIQDAVDGMKTPGALLLKAGTYYVDGQIKITRSGVVIRGEGEGKTKVVARGKGRRSLFVFGEPLKIKAEPKASSVLTEKYVPLGRMYVEVKAPSKFKVGDQVILYQEGTDEWIHAIKMDQIEQGFDAIGRLVKQWKPKEYNITWERVVTKIDGNKIYFDNPTVLGINTEMSPSKLYVITTNRISGCGIENLTLESTFDPEIKTMHKFAGNVSREVCIDEDHGWVAVEFKAAEHSWVRDITSRYFGYGLVHLIGGAKYVTVQNCKCLDPVSFIAGGRRYAFCFAGCQMCLVKDCLATEDRHGCVVNGRTPGPNVFVDCEIKPCYSDIGPHNRFATGCLYDRVMCAGTANARDRGSSGFGHGWAGATMVFWNTTAESFIVQNVWDVAKNYAVGCIGKQILSKDRPEGVWVSHGKNVEPSSLYEYQLQLRKEAGIKAAPAECYK